MEISVASKRVGSKGEKKKKKKKNKCGKSLIIEDVVEESSVIPLI